MLRSSPVRDRSFLAARSRTRSWALAALAAILALPAFAQECPTGQRRMTFPPDGYFEFWRYSTVGSNRATEEWWYSESRQKRHERLPLNGGSLDEYFDFATQQLTIVQYAGSTIIQCDRFTTPIQYQRPSVGPWCFQPVSEENLGGLLPVERWNRVSGIIVSQDVFAQRIGEELIPLWLYNRESSTIYTAYLNFNAEVDDADLDLPCTPVDIPGSASEALRDLETRHGLPPGTLTGTEEGQ